ncbi:hypothetical protein [Lutimonas sp.]|uniref:hypothetical protein n=1 Tax=Lutimonas sp. TaxID=1872403 RepID=UPI003D9B46E5
MENIFEFDLFSILISTCYFGLVIAALMLLLSYGKKIKKNAFFSLVFGVSLYYSFFLLNHLFPFKSTAPDSIYYANIITDFWGNYDAWTIGVKLYALINFIPFQFSLRYPVVFILINIFFFYAGVIFIGKSFIRLMRFYDISISKNFMAHLLLYTAFYPAAIIIIPTLLREGSMIFFFGLCTYSLSIIYTETERINKANIAVFIIALILLTLIRPIGGVSYMVAIFVFYLFRSFKKGSVKNILISLFSLLLFVLLINFIVDTFYNLSFSFSWIDKFRASHKELFGTESYGTELNWSGGWASMKSSFLLFLQYLFSPFPILIPTGIALQKTIPLLDACFIFFSIVPALFYSKIKPVKIILYFCFILLMIPAFVETHITGAYRHRMNAIVMLLPVFAFAMNKVLFKITSSK